MKLVYRYRVKSLIGLLNRQSQAVNFVWNYCNDRQKDALRFGRRWHTGFDLIRLTTGCSKDIGLHSSTINDICQRYARARAQSHRPYLRYRGKKSLRWVPLKGRELKREGNAFRFAGNSFRVFYSRPLPAGKILDGTNFSRDRRGNWFLNICIEVAAPTARAPLRAIGIDLGLKELATLSDGTTIGAPHFYRAAEAALALAQRAHKTRRVKTIHAKVANQRQNYLHTRSSAIVAAYDYIVVGNVNASALAKTSMAKSVYDVSWSSFRTQLAYKAVKHGAWFEEVDERFTTQVCSDCGAMPDSRPRGIADLGIRVWTCDDCGAVHDRDRNAAINILRRGRATLGVGISILQGGGDVQTKLYAP